MTETAVNRSFVTFLGPRNPNVMVRMFKLSNFLRNQGKMAIFSILTRVYSLWECFHLKH